MLDHAGILVTGAGRGVAHARRPAVFSAAGGRVGMIAFSDHPVEYAAGDDERLGIAHADLRRELPDWLRAEIAALRESCDVVIAFPHGNRTWHPRHSRGSFAGPWSSRTPARTSSPDDGDLIAGDLAVMLASPEDAEDQDRGLRVYDAGQAPPVGTLGLRKAAHTDTPVRKRMKNPLPRGFNRWARRVEPATSRV